MKNLIITLIIALFAVTSHAASIDWGNASSSLIYDLDGNKITSKNYAAMSLCFSLIDSNGNVLKESIAINSMTAGMLSNHTTHTYAYETEYKNGDVFTIVGQITVDGKKYEMTVGEFTLAATDDTGTDVFTWATGTYGGLAGQPGAGTAQVWTPVAIPEPTSALLVLLGVAGMALKRKRA